MAPPSAPNILVVEDNPDVADSIRDLLLSEGYAVTAVENGQEALDFLQSRRLPDLVILDLWMPVMDGWELLRRLRENPVQAAIPRIVLSAVGDTSRLSPEDAVGCFTKPFDPAALLEAIRDCLG